MDTEKQCVDYTIVINSFLCDTVYNLHREHKFPEVSQHNEKKFFGNIYIYVSFDIYRNIIYLLRTAIS